MKFKRFFKFAAIPLGVFAFCGFTLIVLSTSGLVRAFSVPTDGMSPAISRGDNIIMEGITYLLTKPKRGDIIIFKTDGIPSIPKASIYQRRLVGLAGDRLRLSDGILYINDEPTSFKNKDGRIFYANLAQSRYLASSSETVTVPEKHYFVIGDNSAHSADSRFWGFLPTESVLGRAAFCYSPSEHRGFIR